MGSLGKRFYPNPKITATNGVSGKHTLASRITGCYFGPKPLVYVPAGATASFLKNSSWGVLKIFRVSGTIER